MKKKPTRRSKRAPLRWIGGKTKIMPQLLPLMPHHHCYVSVFGGGGCDIYNKPRSAVEIYNDRHHLLGNFFNVLRDRKSRHEVSHMLEYSPISRRQFEECLATLADPQTDRVKLAWAFAYVSHLSFGGMDPATATSGSFTPSVARRGTRWKDISEHLKNVAFRFRTVILEEQDWSVMLDKYDAVSTLFYLDPPYVPGTRQPNIYAHEMSVEDHERLLERLMQIEGYAMLSGYESKLYADRLAHWRRVEIPTRAWMAPVSEKPVRTEIVWMNYDAKGNRLT